MILKINDKNLKKRLDKHKRKVDDVTMRRLELQSKLNEIKPGTGMSNLRDSDCRSRFSGFFIGDKMKRLDISTPKYPNTFTLVDDESFEELSKHKWCVQKGGNTFYAVRNMPRDKNGKRKRVQMHRQIMNCPDNLQTDHINHNGLDNRKMNLRVCTHSENHGNSLPRKGCTSKHKGVSRHGGKWQSRIKHNSKEIYLGFFATEIEAAEAYDAKAKELFGEFAYLNFESGISSNRKFNPLKIASV